MSPRTGWRRAFANFPLILPVVFGSRTAFLLNKGRRIIPLEMLRQLSADGLNSGSTSCACSLTLAVAEDGVYGSNELAPSGAQFADALLHHALEHTLALGKKRHENLATIFLASGASDITVPFEAVHEFNGT